MSSQIPASLLRGQGGEFVDCGEGVFLHPLAVAPWRALCAAARGAGFELAAASAHRGFERQCAIWNAKAEGRRPVHDDAGRALDILALAPSERLHALLRYSAIPGTSRHHWGSELDVYDRAALGPDQRVRLEPWESAAGGPFAPLHRWLDDRIQAGRAFGFFRPYRDDRGGVAPERWHLSYAPLAAACQRHCGSEGLVASLRAAGVALVDEIEAQLPRLWPRYVEVPARAYPEPWRRAAG